MAVPASFRVLRHRQLALVVLGNLVSQLGFWSQYVGVGWAVNSLTDSSVALGAAFAAPWVPGLLLSPVAGVLADRYDRRRMVIAGNVAMALPPFLIGLLLQQDVATVPSLVVLVFLGGVAQALTQPATGALVPELVPGEEVQQAIALNSGVMNGSRIIGPGIGGFAIRAWGIEWAFHLNAVSFFAVVVAWLFVTVPPVVRVPDLEPFLDRLRAGATYARGHPSVGRLLLLVGVAGFFVMQGALMPVFASDVLDGDAGTYAALSAAPGIGALIGAFLAGELAGPAARRRALAVAAPAMGACLVAFAVSRAVMLSVVLLAGFGVAFFMVNTIATTIVTTEAAPEFRGRVLGLLGTANIGLVPINAVVAGLLASAVGAVWTVAAAGSGLVAFTLWFVLSGQLAGVGAREPGPTSA